MLQRSLLFCSLLLAVNSTFSQSVVLNASSDPDRETGGKLCSDEQGNVYLLGRFNNSFTLGTHTISSAGNNDMYLAKFDRYLQPLWLNRIGSTGNDVPGDLAYYNGHLYMSGSYGASMIIDDDTLVFSGNNVLPAFISILDTSGNFIKAKAFTTNNTVNGYFNSLAVNAHGIAIGGALKGELNFGPGHVVYNQMAGTETDILVARLDLNLTCRFAVTAYSVYSSQYGNESAMDIEMDNQGNIYTAGSFGSLSSSNSATLYWGPFVISTTGTMGFSDLFYAKLDSTGNCKWLQPAGSNLPDGISNICLMNDTTLAIGGIYSGITTVGGLPLPPSPSTRSRFIAVIDSAGAGIYGYRTGPEIYNFNSLKKGGDNFIYAAAITPNSSNTYFTFYKVDPATGVQFKDSILVGSVNPYFDGDLLPPSGSCDQLIINSTFFRRAVHGTDTLLIHSSATDLDFFYGKYYLQGGPVGTPSIDPMPLSHCSNSNGVALSVQPVANANTYHWTVVPSLAGAIMGSGPSVAYSLNPSYTGSVVIHSYASNACDISGEDSVVLTINQAPQVLSVTASGGNTIATTVVGQTDFNWFYENSPLSFLNTTSIPCQGSGTYIVVAINSNGCSDTLSNLISCSTTGIHEQYAPVVKIYPNPAEDHISIENAPTEGVFAIYNLLGELVMQQEAENKINVSCLAPGSYLLKFNGRNGAWMARFVKK